MAGLKQVFVQSLTEVSLKALDTLGDIRIEGGKIYKYVQLRNVTATVVGAAGDLVCYRANTGGTDSQVVTDWTDADAAPVGAGMLLATVAGGIAAVQATAEFVWLQIKGNAIMSALAAPTGDGVRFKAHATSDKVTAAIAAFTDPAVGAVLDTTARTVLLDCSF
jgi:hypothetical protein